MKFHSFPNYESVSQKAAQLIIALIQTKPDVLICIATGNSPKRTYELLSEYEKKHLGFFRNISIIQLDEWMGLSEKDESSCAHFIQHQIITPLAIQSKNVFFFNGKTEKPKIEIEKANQFLDNKGKIDLCILGMGKNGHLGFNEPASEFSRRTHLVSLEKETQNHSMVGGLEFKPQFGITLGMEDILNSEKVILIATGQGKRKVFKQFSAQKIDPKIPVSALWGHKDVICMIDESAF